jgi:hypothetical protein
VVSLPVIGAKSYRRTEESMQECYFMCSLYVRL